MLKKIILFFVFILSFLLFVDFSFGACSLDSGGSIQASLKTCLSGKDVMQPTGSDMKVATGFKSLIVSFVEKIGQALAVIAIGSIAYGSMVIVVSAGNDEKIKKGRNIIKWSLIGFTVLVSAAGLVKIMIYMVYGL